MNDGSDVEKVLEKKMYHHMAFTCTGCTKD